MKEIKLENYGIFPLTGEACSYCLRMLCDVSDQGKAILCAYFGADITFREPMNSYTTVLTESKESTKVKHTGSIMIDRAILWDHLLVFIGLHEANWVAVTDGQVQTCTEEELAELREMYRDWNRPFRCHSIICPENNVNGRQIHAFTGRIE